MYHVVNFNIGKGSRTIIASEVNAPLSPETFIPQYLSSAELENPLKTILDFFGHDFPLPEARLCLEDLALKVAYDLAPKFWKRNEDSIRFVLAFSRLIEAAFLLRNEVRVKWKTEKVRKANLIPSEILQKGTDMNTILPYLPASKDPKDAFDPLLNLQIIFYDTHPQKILESLKSWGACMTNHHRSGKELIWSSHVNKMIFEVILDSCHLIYVRSRDI